VLFRSPYDCADNDHCVQHRNMRVQMHLSTILIVGVIVVGVIVVRLIATRSRAPVDLGSVSTSWTTQHNAADRGGDRSNG
jgi:hypothetical protein